MPVRRPDRRRRGAYAVAAHAFAERLEPRRLLCAYVHPDGDPETTPASTGGPGAGADAPKVNLYPRSGVVKVLLLQAEFDGQSLSASATHAANAALAADVRALYRRTSSYVEGVRGIDLQFTVPQEVVHLDRDEDEFESQINSLAVTSLALAGFSQAHADDPAYDLGSFDIILGLSSASVSGVATLGAGVDPPQMISHVSTSSTGDARVAVAMHELGHNLGLAHSNAWQPGDARTVSDDASPIGPGTSDEYGDWSTFMGRGAKMSHLNLIDKYRFGWVAPSEVERVTATTVSTSGTYRLYAHDYARDPAAGWTVDNGVYGLLLPMDQRRDYWIEYRNQAGDTSANDYTRNGVQLRWNGWTGLTAGSPSADGTQIIDMNTTRRSDDLGIDQPAEASLDAALTSGQSFVDLGSNLTITTLGVGSDANGPFCEVRVKFGFSVAAPTIDLAAETTNLSFAANVPFNAAPTNLRSIRFEAKAADPDGTPAATLDYLWEVALPAGRWQRIHSGASSQRVLTHAFAVQGVHRVRVTVGDGTGHVASDTVLVQVGTGATPILSGRVVDAYGMPVAGATVAHYKPNTLTGSESNEVLYDSAITDDDGFYAVVRSTEALARLVVSKAGYTIDMIRETGAPALTAATRVDFVAAAASSVLVSGRATGETGQAIPGATINVGGHLAVTDETGRYAVRVPRGRHAISGSFAGGWPLRSLDGYTAVDAAVGDAEPFDFFAGGPAATTLRVTLQGWDPDVDSIVTLRDSGGRIYRNLAGQFQVGQFDVPIGYLGATHLWTTGDNRYAFGTPSAPTAAYVATASSNGAPIPVTLVKLPAGTRTISGRVRADDGVAGVAVRLLANGTPIRTSVTDAYGLYAFVDLTTGSYTVEVTPPGGSILTQNATIALNAEGVASDVQRNFALGRSSAAPAFVTLDAALRERPLPFAQLRRLTALATGDPSVRFTWSSPDAGVRFVTEEAGRAGVTDADAEPTIVAAVFPAAGTYTVTCVAADRFGDHAPATQAFTIVVGPVVDQIAPVLRSIGFAFEREQALYLQFSEPLAAGFDLETAMTLTNGTTNQTADWADYATTFVDGLPATARIKKNTGGQVFADGRYLLAVALDLVPDAGGRLGLGAGLREFTMLGGDATMDGTTGSFDYYVLGMNWNAANATWSMGDFNYDGVVNSFDYYILGSRWGQSV